MDIDDVNSHFRVWEDAIRQDDWQNCENSAMFLLYSLPRDGELHLSLCGGIERIQTRYHKERKLLESLLKSIANPIQRDRIRFEMLVALERWRANNFYHLFKQSFIEQGLLYKDLVKK